MASATRSLVPTSLTSPLCSAPRTDTCPANAAELMLHQNPSNLDLDRVKQHQLLIRRSDKGYKGVIIGGDRVLRLEGPEGHSALQALELLLELTAELLEGCCEVWEYPFREGEDGQGEEVRCFDDGARVVVGKGGEDGSFEIARRG
ncbi:hypothetical protein BAUCODRAFT_188063 [Baudoinia panamericana UAMH 10762]|uniref:Uncharacterized protein n=1 Tax=Baudoinia panamericana (strain UAMH 10762) TaxID=717646 RepID=M2M1G7_BAUPA|nr:uncharacterized protein BAUCODRAFT_188063 [Baudoinia panamericana UAMH 10762]EMD00893.1 hypothetical protein BAUCODRAFT_188063 [Baudoinia panamericana UAMH 10762]